MPSKTAPATAPADTADYLISEFTGELPTRSAVVNPFDKPVSELAEIYRKTETSPKRAVKCTEERRAKVTTLLQRAGRDNGVSVRVRWVEGTGLVFWATARITRPRAN